MIKKRTKQLFPMDFYGDHNGWRFIARANNSDQVLRALMWRAYICLHRKQFNLFAIATQTFAYSINNLPAIDAKHDYSSRIKMLGPVVEVNALEESFAFEIETAKKADSVF